MKTGYDDDDTFNSGGLYDFDEPLASPSPSSNRYSRGQMLSPNPRTRGTAQARTPTPQSPTLQMKDPAQLRAAAKKLLASVEKSPRQRGKTGATTGTGTPQSPKPGLMLSPKPRAPNFASPTGPSASASGGRGGNNR